MQCYIAKRCPYSRMANVLYSQMDIESTEIFVKFAFVKRPVQP